MSDDPLDKESSVSLELTESGVTAKSNLRAVSGFDRLLGNVSDFFNVKLERKISRERATIEGEKILIAATAAEAVKKIAVDDEFANRAITSLFKDAARKQLNKDGVVAAAVEDLRVSPPTEEQANKGPDSLSEEFIDRLDHYAGTASTEELRARWGRVLASEIRQPGTFSHKVLRVTDEIDASTARVFERLCENRIDDLIPYPFAKRLAYPDRLALIEAGLLIDPGLGGQAKNFGKVALDNGHPIWFFDIGKHGIAYDRSVPTPQFPDESALANTVDNQLGIHCYLLTSAGEALAGILDYDLDKAFHSLIAELRSKTQGLRVYMRSGESNQFHLVEGASFTAAKTPDQTDDSQ